MPTSRRAPLLATLALSLWLAPQSLLAQQSDAAATEEAAPAVNPALQSARDAYDAGRWDEALATYDTLYKDAASSQTLKAEAALERSSILWEQGHYAEAKSLAEEALELARKQRLDGAVGRLLVTIGHIETSQGKLTSAKNTFAVCAKLSQESNDEVFAAICRMNLSLIDRLRGHSGGSDAQFERDIAALKSAKTPLAAGSALAKTGEMFAQSGDYGRAMEMLEQAQAHFETAKSKPAQARNRLRIARVLQSAGHYDRAHVHLELAKPELTRMKNRPALVDLHGLLGKEAEQRRDKDAAKSEYIAALDLAKSIKNPQLTAKGQLALCELLIRPVPEAGASPYCDAAATTFEKLAIPELEIRAKIAQANIDQQLEMLPRARERYQEVVTLMMKLPESSRDASALATQRANLCQLDNALEVTGALLSCRDALEALEKLPDTSAFLPHLHTTAYSAAFAAQREKRYKQALVYFEKSSKYALAASSPDRLRAADARLRMGIIYGAVLKGEDDAISAFQKGISILDGASGEPEQRLLVQLHEQLLQQLVTQSQWERARDQANALLALTTSRQDDAASARTYNNLAVASLKLSDKPAAIEALKKGIACAERARSEPEQLALMKANLKKLDR